MNYACLSAKFTNLMKILALSTDNIDPLPNSLQEDLINIGKTKLSLSYIYFLLYVQPSSIHVCYLQRDSIYFEFS